MRRELETAADFHALLAHYRDEWAQAPEAVYTARMHRALLVMLAQLDARITAIETTQD